MELNQILSEDVLKYLIPVKLSTRTNSRWQVLNMSPYYRSIDLRVPMEIRLRARVFLDFHTTFNQITFDLTEEQRSQIETLSNHIRDKAGFVEVKCLKMVTDKSNYVRIPLLQTKVNSETMCFNKQGQYCDILDFKRYNLVDITIRSTGLWCKKDGTIHHLNWDLVSIRNV